MASRGLHSLRHSISGRGRRKVRKDLKLKYSLASCCYLSLPSRNLPRRKKEKKKKKGIKSGIGRVSAVTDSRLATDADALPPRCPVAFEVGSAVARRGELRAQATRPTGSRRLQVQTPRLVQ